MTKTTIHSFTKFNLKRSRFQIGDGLSSADLVAGLRSVYQLSLVELADRPERDAKLYTLAVACTLADVALAFGLTDSELIEIVGERQAEELKQSTPEAVMGDEVCAAD